MSYHEKLHIFVGKRILRMSKRFDIAIDLMRDAGREADNMSVRKNSKGNFRCRDNFSFGCENLFPAGGHERVLLPTQHITSIRIGNEVDFTPQHSSSGIRGWEGHRHARGITGTPRI